MEVSEVNVFSLNRSFLLQGDTFVVPAGGLAFSVATYTICAVICIIILMVRRSLAVFGNAELGGPKVPSYISAGCLAFLWVLYVLLSSLYEYKLIRL